MFSLCWLSKPRIEVLLDVVQFILAATNIISEKFNTGIFNSCHEQEELVCQYDTQVSCVHTYRRSDLLHKLVTGYEKSTLYQKLPLQF